MKLLINNRTKVYFPPDGFILMFTFLLVSSPPVAILSWKMNGVILRRVVKCFHVFYAWGIIRNMPTVRICEWAEESSAFLHCECQFFAYLECWFHSFFWLQHLHSHIINSKNSWEMHYGALMRLCNYLHHLFWFAKRANVFFSLQNFY